MTTPLHRNLARLIRETGPITVAEYMSHCLWDPAHGYYATREPLGAAGDFTTAPEISQMFGEIIGLCLVQAWEDQGAPRHFCLAELGPGRGTLMADMLRAAAMRPDFLAGADVCLIERSPTLRKTQADTLKEHAVTWLDDVSALPDLPLLVVANEFFDALPIRQFQRHEAGWREVNIGLHEHDLVAGLSDAYPFAALDHRLSDTRPGDIVEYCPGLPEILASIARRIEKHGGGALIIDYGGETSLGDTFQAVRNHESVSPFECPGAADLTAHVDFGALASEASRMGLASSRLTPQGVFLERLGITARAQNLARRMAGPDRETHVAAHRRLTHPDEMGTVFKVLGLTGTDAPSLPGLSP